MISLLLFLQTAVAQPQNLVVKQGDAVRVVPVIGSTTGSYIRADLLAAALGGTVSNAPNAHYRISLGDNRLELLEGVPFLRADTSVVPMTLPALRSGNTFLLPYQVASVVIPRYASGFFYDTNVRELRIFTTVTRHYSDPQP
jgi:hypothetical protein